MSASPPSASHDFDFLIGKWRIDNQKLVGLLRGSDEWEHFGATSHARALPGGIGNYDEFVAERWRPGYVGMTLRVYNPPTDLWSLFWLNNRDGGIEAQSGNLTSPVVGRFRGDEGIFEGDDVIEGRAVRVRYLWQRADSSHATWRQACSPDDGAHWEVNWVMEMQRLSE